MLCLYIILRVASRASPGVSSYPQISLLVFVSHRRRFPPPLFFLCVMSTLLSAELCAAPADFLYTFSFYPSSAVVCVFVALLILFGAVDIFSFSSCDIFTTHEIFF